MRGTFVFPREDTDFLQLLELRANNGALDDVETVFVLTGDTYYVPTHLFAFDTPTLYVDATERRVDAKNERMARTLARYYTDQSGPNLIARFHTHPNGETRPSRTDTDGAAAHKAVFDHYFDDYEFFFGIHALREPCDPDPTWLRQPVKTANHEISWWGENRKHTLAIFDATYEPRPVVIC